jgi:hypothetical protein
VQVHSRIALSQLAVPCLRDHLAARTRGLNHFHVKALAQCLDLPSPIVVHEGSVRVIDGLHRLRATHAESAVERRAVSFALVLERLKRDPAVRFNEAGRNLVRQFVAGYLAVTSCRQMLPFTPTHCLVTAADLAVAQAQA